MKLVVYALAVGGLVGTNFNIITGVTWGDIAASILLIIAIVCHLLGKWRLDMFSKLSAIYLPFMLVSAIINAELLNTIFINYFRNYLWGILFYDVLSNTIHSIKDIKRILVMFAAYLLFFLLNFKSMMDNTYYDTIATLDFGYGRNNVAFTALLLSIFFLFLYYSKLLKFYILVGIVLMSIIITFCASRYAMIMLVLSFILFYLCSRKGTNLKEILLFLLIAVVGGVVYHFVIGFIDESFYEFSQSYLNDKINGAGNDFWTTRILEINVKPVTNVLQSNNPLLVLMFGAPEAIQHSFLSHTLITTGLIGCLCFVVTHIKILFWSYQFKGVYFFLFLIVMVMFVNDFITNSRFIVTVNSMLYGMICAILYNYMKIYENFNISNRDLR